MAVVGEHLILITEEELNGRTVFRPRCQCGWDSQRAYLREAFARSYGDETHGAEVRGE